MAKKEKMNVSRLRRGKRVGKGTTSNPDNVEKKAIKAGYDVHRGTNTVTIIEKK